ncbi:MAG: hypothetical protein KDC35_05725 [Acidobacteria bacterium]|nr:hypothetical protein [Acidobacteriota bacterium]
MTIARLSTLSASALCCLFIWLAVFVHAWYLISIPIVLVTMHKRFHANPAFTVVITLLVLALFPNLFAPDDFQVWSQPSKHLLGQDRLGRDQWILLLMAHRVSIQVALLSALLASAVSIVFGIIVSITSGISGSVMRTIHRLALAFPIYILILFGAAVTPGDLYLRSIVMGLLMWGEAARLIESRITELSHAPFSIFAHLRGEATWRIWICEWMPNMRVPITANFLILFSSCLVLDAALGYVGVAQEGLGRLLNTCFQNNSLRMAGFIVGLLSTWLVAMRAHLELRSTSELDTVLL